MAAVDTPSIYLCYNVGAVMVSKVSPTNFLPEIHLSPDKTIYNILITIKQSRRLHHPLPQEVSWLPPSLKH